MTSSDRGGVAGADAGIRPFGYLTSIVGAGKSRKS
jgi:hypothetical protein